MIKAENSGLEMGRGSCGGRREQTFIMPPQLVVNVACSVGGVAADMALRYSYTEMAML